MSAGDTAAEKGGTMLNLIKTGQDKTRSGIDREGHECDVRVIKCHKNVLIL